MLKMKKMKFIFLATAWLASPMLSSAQQVLTLKDALNYALEHNANVKKAALDIERGRFKTDEVRAQALPQINGNLGLTYNAIIGQQVVDFGGVSQKLKFGKEWNSVAGAQLSQQLFNQQVFTGLQAAHSSESYYQLSALLSQEQVIEQVANNYYQVLVNRLQTNVIDSNIKSVKIIADIVGNQYKNGLARKIDVDRINVNLTNLQNQRLTVVNAISMLENQLKYNMGLSVETPLVLPETELKEIYKVPALADTLGMSNRTEVRLLDVQRKLLKLQKKAYVAEYYPALMLNANYSFSSQSTKFDFLKSNPAAIAFDVSAISLTLRIPIFNGFMTRARVRQAEVDIQKFELDYWQLKNGLNMGYENAKVQMRNSVSAIKSQKKNMDLAREINKSTQNNYKNGLATLTDLLDTENALTQAQNSYSQALLNYKVAEIQLIKSQGNIKSLVK
jgi:outer membrane protein TolC